MITDPIWRLNNLYQIVPEEGGGSIPLVLRDEQTTFAEEAHNRNMIIKCRKLGFSTLIELQHLDAALSSPQTHCAIVDRKGADAEKKLAIAKLAWDRGPLHPDSAIAAVWRGIHDRIKLVTDNHTLLEWDNGSKIEAGVSFRGGTPQRLHVSELGPVAAEDHRRAAEIVAGAMAAVPPGGRIDVETTYKGGRFGHCYRICKLAMDMIGKPLNVLDWKFFGFLWWQHPSYTLPPRELSGSTILYFRNLEASHGIRCTPGQMTWWESTKALQREAMAQEYPSTVDEVFDARTEGAIYPIMTKLRTEGRVNKPLDAERGPPLFTSWDIGISDYMAGWMQQPVGRQLLWLRACQFDGLGAQAVADVIRDWEAQMGRRITMNFLPHDADAREAGSGLSFKQQLIKAGIDANRIAVVPRTPDLWAGIDSLRTLLQRSYFDSSCDIPIEKGDGVTLPSAVGCLEGYRKQPPGPSGRIIEMPLHDMTSHAASAARTFAEAFDRGLVPVTESARRLTSNVIMPGDKPRQQGGIWDDLDQPRPIRVIQ